MAKATDIRVDLAVPLVDSNLKDAENTPLFDRIIAIDLGERRIGYAVFDLEEICRSGEIKPAEEEGRPIYGSVAVPSIRRLIKAVKRHRSRGQPGQKIQQTYSTALMRLRENVIGDVCNRIETLCERYGGFPVLESSISNLESGSKQLQLVYGSVVRLYSFSNIDAHKKARKDHWFTGDRWKHPYLLARQWDEQKRNYSGQAKPVNLFPGATVHPAGTSQECHCCGRNPVSDMRAQSASMEVETPGELHLNDGMVMLMERASYDEAELRHFRRRKERPPLNVPLKPGKHRREHLLRILRMNLRRPSHSLMSPDTTQSQYHCVYNDCGWAGHADENAAINIGKRYLSRVDWEKTLKKYREISS